MKFKIIGVFLFFISLIILLFGKMIKISGEIIESSKTGSLFNPFISCGIFLLIFSLIIIIFNQKLETIVVPTGPSYEADRQRAEAGARKYREDKINRQMLISGKYNDGICFLASQPIKIYKTLRKSGIPRDRILFESESNNTQENVLYVCKKIREMGLDNLTIITDEDHARRFQMLFRKAKEKGYIPKNLEVKTYSEGVDSSYGKGKAILAYLKDYLTFK